ncbi:hypothetical protein TBK1r_67750 [Stieleria magnilauensis]|uniref:Uncharacterized protein n=1 Tax=Stieleria magnilauensis TaxID=2527963 RepID=A0ABX5Y0E8_9BACT|nr:hypothetical protein TBK1r_67750 [Planctomycetes bacterium TBK1r]
MISRLARAYGPSLEETTLNLTVLGFSRLGSLLRSERHRLKARHQRVGRLFTQFLTSAWSIAGVLVATGGRGDYVWHSVI